MSIEDDTFWPASPCVRCGANSEDGCDVLQLPEEYIDHISQCDLDVHGKICEQCAKYELPDYIKSQGGYTTVDVVFTILGAIMLISAFVFFL